MLHPADEQAGITVWEQVMATEIKLDIINTEQELAVKCDQLIN